MHILLNRSEAVCKCISSPYFGTHIYSNEIADFFFYHRLGNFALERKEYVSLSYLQYQTIKILQAQFISNILGNFVVKIYRKMWLIPILNSTRSVQMLKSAFVGSAPYLPEIFVFVSDAEFDSLELTPLSNPPELPDGMKLFILNILENFAVKI